MLANATSVTVRAPAKINLSLGIGSRRADGFHDVCTVLQSVDLSDEVILTPASELSLQITGAESAGLSADAANLAWRAAELLAARTARSPAVRIQLTKRIPVAAGLAGGSADAAAVLRGLDELWQLSMSADELGSLAAELGSDVHFALVGGTALATGRGELLSPLPSWDLHWVLAVADGELSTAAVYGELDAQRNAGVAAPPISKPVGIIAALRTRDLGLLASSLANDLQPAALALAPYLTELLDAGRAATALAGLVSGSGPTIALLARSSEHAAQICAALNADTVCRYAITVRGAASGARVQGRSDARGTR